MHYVFEPGLFASGPVRTALLVGAVVAVTSGVIGVFTVIRGQSFAGHSLADVATTGGSGAFLVRLNQFWGFLAAGAIGAVVSTALLIGPSATALRVTKSPGWAMAASALTGVAATWIGIVLAYDSSNWPPYGHGWPVSFFVVVLVLIGYLLTFLKRPRRLAPRSPHEGAECSPA